MKINGQKLKDRQLYEVFIPRGNDDGILFRAQAVDLSDIPIQEPEVPLRREKGKAPVKDTENAKYREAKEDYDKKVFAYLIIKSLQPTEGLEWENVNLDDPNTWEKYLDELKESGFTNIEINNIIQGVLRANSLDEDYISKRRNDFLASQG